MRTKHYKHLHELEDALYREITVKIELSIQEYGDARILLSGGSTPKGLYQKIAQAPLDWKNVTIGLVDDRNVDLASEFSNERMLRQTFIGSEDNAPVILGMVGENLTSKKLERRYAIFFERVDYTLLGMGDDGHTASLFPNDGPSESSLRKNEKQIIFTTAPSYPEDRISCSKGLLFSSHSIGLMIRGKEKLAVLNNSEEKMLPIAYFSKNCQQLTTYYCES